MKHYDITNLSLKKDVLTYFFDRINYYEYRYIMLKTYDDFKKNEKNIEYVKVKSHSNNLDVLSYYNDKVDKLAQNAC